MFGAPAASPFGAPNTNPFGASTSTPAFGQSTAFGASTAGGLFGAKPLTPSSPFGQTPFGGGTATGVFGATQSAFGATTPAFGASSTPAFGVTTTPAFGGFGQQQQQQKPAFGFGQTQANPFGGGSTFGQTGGFGVTSTFGASTPAFGQQSTPAFGAASTPAFGQTATPAFGSSTPAFGASSTPAFGATTASPFGGSPAFGSSTPAFGSAPAGFGATAFGGAQKPGTRGTPYQVTNDVDSQAAGSQPSKFVSISAMPQHRNKSVEELRWEDYQQGDKGGPSAAGQAAPGGGMFGAAPQSSPFATSTPAFGGAPATPSPFGASSSPFGAPSSTPAFGQSSSPAFGAPSAPTFGQSPSPFGQPFGGTPASTPAFGQASTPAFGASTGLSFGGGSLFGASTSAFGPSGSTFGTSTFGAPSQASPFGTTTPAFGQASTPAFGQASAPAFGGSSLFGGTSGSAFGTGAFGASSSPAFGTSTPAFGQSSSPFGSSLFTGTAPGTSLGFGQTKPAGLTMSAPGTTPSLFGNFGQSQAAPSTGGAFSFSSGGGLFGQSQPATGSMFGGSPPNFGGGFGTATTPGFGGLQMGAQTGMPQQQMQQQVFQAQPVANPFGTLPMMPQMNIQRSAGTAPAVQYGISNLPLSDKAPQTARSSSMLTPRHLTPRAKGRLHARRLQPGRKETPGKVSFFSDAVAEATPSPKADVLFVPRENPRALFIREVPDQIPANGSTTETPARPEAEADDGDARVEATATPGRTGGAPADQSPVADRQEPDQPLHASPSPAARDKGKQPMQYPLQDGPASEFTANGHFANGHRPIEAAIAYEHGAEIEALMPKLRNMEQGYYTEPMIGELAAKERAEGGYTRRVKDFKVGRRGYGWVQWPGETDVRRLDLQEVVQLNKAEVVVYPDESKKPDVGRGLNKPAVAALLNIFCIDKETGRAITEGTSVEKFEQKLRKRVEKQGAHFVSYDSVKGEWRFKVDHFSRYGLIDSDEEDDDILGAAEAVQRAAGEVVVHTGEVTTSMEAIASETRDEFAIEDGSPMEEADLPERAALAHSLPQQLGLNPWKMHQMRENMFFMAGSDAPEEDGVPQGLPKRTPDRSKVNLIAAEVASVKRVARGPPVWHQRLPNKVKGKAGKGLPAWPSPARERTPLRQRLAPSGPLVVLNESPLLSPEILGSVAKKARKDTVGFVEEGDPVVEKNEAVASDAGLFLGRSFRACWGPGGTLVHAGNPIGRTGLNRKTSAIVLEKVALVTDKYKVLEEPNPEIDRLVAPLQKVLEWEDSSPVESVTPVAQQEPARRVLQCGREALGQLTRSYLEDLESELQVASSNSRKQVLLQHQQMVWELTDVLFSEDKGPMSGLGIEDMDETALSDQEDQLEQETDEVADSFKRRGRFSAWLQKHIASSVEQDLENEDSAMARVFAYLTGRKLEEAVSVAAASGDIRLSMLLSQAGSRSANKADVAAQLATWEKIGVSLDQDRARVYNLLAGNVSSATQSLDIDWKRYLGLLLWHGTPVEQPMETVFQSYKEAIGHPGVPAPIPLYVERGLRHSGSQVRAPFDTLFYLLLLFAKGPVDEASLRTMLRSASATPDWLDGSLTWNLLMVLQAIGVLEQPDDSDTLAEGVEPFTGGGWGLHEVYMGYAAQLAAAGLPEWAVFVALHLPGRQLRESAVKELLAVYCGDWCHAIEKRKFLQQVLHVPPTWLRAAEATYYKYHRDSGAETEALLDSHQWQAAHTILINTLAPSLFLAGKHPAIVERCQQLALHAGEIENWRYGGQLYLDYYQIRDAFLNPHSAVPELVEVERHTLACQSLFARMEDAPQYWKDEATKTLRSLVLTKMAERLSGLLFQEDEAPTEAVAAVICQVSLQAPLPEDLRTCRLQQSVTTFANLLEPVS